MFKLEKPGGIPRLRPNQVIEIRLKHATGKYSYRDLGDEYVVHPETIRHLVKYRTWRKI